MSRRLTTTHRKLDKWERNVTRCREIAFAAVCDGIMLEPVQLLELLFIVINSSDADRTVLIREIAEETYPEGSEGFRAIQELIEQAKKGAR